MKRAYKINDKTETDFLRKPIAKEMLKVKVDYVEKRNIHWRKSEVGKKKYT